MEHKHVLVAPILVLSGISCIIGGYFTAGVITETLVLGGSILTAFAGSKLLLDILNYYRYKSFRPLGEISSIDIGLLGLCTVLAMGFGYGISHLGLGSLLPAHFTFAESIATKAAIGGAVALIPAICYIFLLKTLSASNPSTRSNFICCAAIMAATAVATVTGVLVTSAIQLEGEIAIAAECFMASASLVLFLGLVYSLYSSQTDYQLLNA